MFVFRPPYIDMYLGCSVFLIDFVLYFLNQNILHMFKIQYTLSNIDERLYQMNGGLK